MTIHPPLSTQITILLLLGDEPIDCLTHRVLELPRFLVTFSPAIKAKQGQAGGSGIEIPRAPVLAGIPPSVRFLIAGKPLKGKPDGALGCIGTSKLLDHFQGWPFALLANVIGEGERIDRILRRLQFSGKEGIALGIGTRQVQAERRNGTLAFQLWRLALGFESGVGDDNVSSRIRGLGSGVAGLDLVGLGNRLGSNVVNLGNFLRLLSFDLRNRLGWAKQVGQRVSLLLCLLRLPGGTFLKDGFLHLGKQGFRQSRALGGNLVGLGHGFFGGFHVGLGGANVADQGSLACPSHNGRGLYVLLRLQDRNLEVALELIRNQCHGSIGNLGLVGHALQGQFLLRESIYAYGNLRGLRLPSRGQFLGDQPYHEEQQDDQVEGDGSREALVVETGYVLPVLEKVDEGRKSGKGEKDPPDDVAEQFHELIPARLVYVFEDLAGGGTIEKVILGLVVLCFGLFVSAEQEIESIHPDGRVGRFSFLEIQVDFLGKQFLPFHYPADVEGKTRLLVTVSIRCEEHVVATPVQGGLDVFLLGVDVLQWLGSGKRRVDRLGFRFLLLRIRRGERDDGKENIVAVANSIRGEEQPLAIPGDRRSRFIGVRIDRLAQRLGFAPVRPAPFGNVKVVTAKTALPVGREVKVGAVLGKRRASIVRRTVENFQGLGARPYPPIPLGGKHFRARLVVLTPHENH